MLSPKIRAITVSLVASASFALATVAPAVSQAMSRSNEAYAKALTCERLRGEEEVFNETATRAHHRGDLDLAKFYNEEAERIWGEAELIGCAWVQFSRPEFGRPLVGGSISKAPVASLG